MDVVMQDLSDESMQSVAAELNLSETSFIRRLHDTDTFDASKST